ncbi:hypothetical protein [Peribacillus sp. N1]
MKVISQNFNEYMLELIYSVYRTYVDRKGEKEIIKNKPGKVVRGTIPSVSSTFENGIGILLHNILVSDYQILVDYPIRLRDGGSMTPDIIVIRNGRVELLLELKNDLGYEKNDWRKKQIERINRLNDTETITYQEFDSKTRLKKVKELTVPRNVPYGTIILCQANGRKRILEVIKEYTDANCRGDKVPYFVLMKDKVIHANHITFEDELNSYLENVVSTEVTSDWERLERYLSTHLLFKQGIFLFNDECTI